MKLSLIVPCFNEEGNILLFEEQARKILKEYDHELIFVNDGSRDRTKEVLAEVIEKKTSNATVINFSRNFGKESAIFAGLQNASGDYIAFIDADLQQPIEVVKEMVDFLDENKDYDAVAAFQDNRIENKIMSRLKKGFYSIINALSDTKLHENASDFRCIRRKVADAILSVSEYHRFSKGIFSWVGYKTFYRPYQVRERHAGTSSWSVFKLFRYALGGIISFSTKPLRLATFFGASSCLASLIWLIVILIQKLALGLAVSGFSAIATLLLFLAGLQFFTLGIIGAYLARIHVEVKNRPIYLAESILKSNKVSESNEDTPKIQ